MRSNLVADKEEARVFIGIETRQRFLFLDFVIWALTSATIDIIFYIFVNLFAKFMISQ